MNTPLGSESGSYKTVRGANLAHIRQSKPGSGLGFETKVLEKIKLFPHCSEPVRDALVEERCHEHATREQILLI